MRHDLSAKNIYLLIALPTLLLVAIACRIPDALEVMIQSATEKCHTVSRTSYEIASAELSQEPETPEDPENVVYQVCYVNGFPLFERMLVSAKMVAGYKTEEDNVSEPSSNVIVQANTSSKLAGTYIGENLEVPPSWNLVKAEFIIQVAEDGTVSGAKNYQIERVSVGPTCTSRWENGHTTVISGYLSGASGLASVQTDSYTIWDMSDCGGTYSHDTFESVCDAAQIKISGNQMEISGDGSEGCNMVFTATKQSSP